MVVKKRTAKVEAVVLDEEDLRRLIGSELSDTEGFSDESCCHKVPLTALRTVHTSF